MKKSVLWSLFWKQQRKPLALALTCIACFILTLWLYHIPLRAIVYPSFLCALLLIAYLCAAYFEHRAQYRRFQPPGASPSTLVTPAYAPTTLEGTLYHTLLSQLHEAQAKAACNVTDERAALTHYYTVWVHQIKTPIAALRLLLHADDSAHARQCTQEVLRIEQYVEMVLAYVRLNTSSTDYLLKPYDVNEIIRQALRRFSTFFIEKKLKLAYEPTPCTVITDEKWLLFVVEQLLSNTLKYTPSGGTITIAITENATLSIRDTGIGIAPQDLPRVFENGYTGTLGRMDKKASGIGLSLCRTICTRLNHSIQIDSVQGEGTCVRVGLAQSSIQHE